jgi:UDP-N-acetylglucosamine--N-acetylmuramyl-(pentapeptide) pyrophosphoryl-undecaprenol N-acetylglucosamine transferase
MSSVKKAKFLFTGGGTGGHVTPALAIADDLKSRNPDATFLYVGVRGKAEETLVPRAGYPIKFVRSLGFPGFRNLPRLLIFSLNLGLGILKSLRILLVFRPTVIVATGGYVSAPILFAATFLRKIKFLRAQIFIHESNVVLGRLNSLAAGFADRVGVSFPETLSLLEPGKAVYVGYPVRKQVAVGDRIKARQELGLPENAKVLFSFGGSQGARTLNRAIVDALPQLMRDPDIYVIHGTGKRLKGNAYDGAADVDLRLKQQKIEPPEGRYIRQDFFYDIEKYYAAADLAVCRAGAGTLTEICAQGLPALIIPKANLPGDHQVANARNLERSGAAQVVYEGVDVAAEEAVESVDGEELAASITKLFSAPEKLIEMGKKSRSMFDPGILDRISQQIEALAAGVSPPLIIAPPLPPADRILGLNSNMLDHLLKSLAAGHADELTEDEARLVRYKIDGFIADSNYIMRARGCRMVGLARYRRRLPVLLYLTEPNGREVGYRQSPIVRRDAIVGLGDLGIVDADVIATLARGLKDPYFEARSETARAIAKLGRKTKEQEALFPLTDPLIELIGDRYFEPRAASIRALAETAKTGKRMMEAYRKLYFDPIWKIRAAIFDGMARLVERGVLEADDAEQEMNKVLITSNGYTTHYPLKISYNRLVKRIGKGRTETEG